MVNLPKNSTVKEDTCSQPAPVCWVIPIRWRQIFRASFARFFRTRRHSGLVLGDLALIALEPWDKFGVLSYPPLHALLVLLLVAEGVLFVADLLYQILYYRTYFYDIREESVVIRRGVICKHELTLPLVRITDVYLDQDLTARMLGLYDLHLSSPTRQSGKVAHMAGIDREGALTLKHAILQRINQADSISFSAMRPAFAEAAAGQARC